MTGNGDQAALAAVFGGHTVRAWQDRPVPEDMLRRLVAMTFQGPTAFNQQPLRLTFVASAAAKARLAPALSSGNLAQTMAAPVTVIVWADLGFWRHLPELWPARDVRGFFDGRPEAARDSAIRNGTLQAGYLILAARALGLGAGPMSGFDAARVTQEFRSEAGGADWQVNFLLNLGWPDATPPRPRLPRLAFDRVARVV